MKKAPDQNKPAKGVTEQRQFNAKSSATEAQRQRIINALRSSPKNSHELRELGVYQQSTRILELRRKGYRITTDRVTLWDAFGYAHRNCALYTLIAAPEVTR